LHKIVSQGPVDIFLFVQQPIKSNISGQDLQELNEEQREETSSSIAGGDATNPMRIEATTSSGGVLRGNRGRRLSPSRMSGGSFDVAVTYGNQLSVLKNTTNGPSPLSSCPATPSSLNDESRSSIVVQVQHHH